MSPLPTTTASLAGLALTTELLQATSATTTAGAPVVSPLFTAHLYSRLVVGRRGCATGSAQWTLCAGPVAAWCSMAVDGAYEARWGKLKSAEGAGGWSWAFGGCDALVSKGRIAAVA